MDSDVAYVRQTNEGEPSSSYDQRYSQYDAQPAGYAEYGHGASEPVSLDSHEEFDPPAHNHKPIPLDFATAALYVVFSYWISFLGPVCVLLFGPKILFIQHHALQGLIVTAALAPFCLIWIWTWIGLMVAFIISVLIVASLSIKALSDYKTGHCFLLPLIGPVCYRWAQKQEAEGRRM